MSSDSLRQLHELMSRAKAGVLPVQTFCETFERIYNFELDRKSVPVAELKRLSALFEIVVLFSPYTEERKTIPNYVGESEIQKALEEWSTAEKS